MPAAAVGTGVVVEGRAFTTIGTSGVVFAHSDRVQIDPAGRVHTFCAAVPGAYTVMSCTLAAGLSLKWYRDTFCQAECQAAKEMGVDPYVLLNEEAAQSPLGANRLLFLPYLMGERSPLLDLQRPGRVRGPQRHSYPPGYAPGGDGGRDVLPAPESGRAAGHESGP